MDGGGDERLVQDWQIGWMHLLPAERGLFAAKEETCRSGAAGAACRVACAALTYAATQWPGVGWEQLGAGGGMPGASCHHRCLTSSSDPQHHICMFQQASPQPTSLPAAAAPGLQASSPACPASGGARCWGAWWKPRPSCSTRPAKPLQGGARPSRGGALRATRQSEGQGAGLLE